MARYVSLTRLRSPIKLSPPGPTVPGPNSLGGSDKQCPRCHAENREGRRFCGECGLSFASTCPPCGFLNEGSEKFCGGCGTSLTPAPTLAEPKFGSPQSYTPQHLAEKILTSKSALEGERKQVTVLFADLKGSMELLADPPRPSSGSRPSASPSRPSGSPITPCAGSCGSRRSRISARRGSGPWRGHSYVGTTKGRFRCLFFLLLEDYIEAQSRFQRELDLALERFARNMGEAGVLVRPLAGDIEGTRSLVRDKPWTPGQLQEVSRTPGLLMIEVDFDTFDPREHRWLYVCLKSPLGARTPGTSEAAAEMLTHLAEAVQDADTDVFDAARDTIREGRFTEITKVTFG